MNLITRVNKTIFNWCSKKKKGNKKISSVRSDRSTNYPQQTERQENKNDKWKRVVVRYSFVKMCRAVNEIADSRPSAYPRTNVEHRGATPRENWRHSRIPIFSAIGSPKEKKNYNRRGRLPLFYAFSKRRSADVESGIFGSCFAKWHRETDSRDKRTRERERGGTL